MRILVLGLILCASVAFASEDREVDSKDVIVIDRKNLKKWDSSTTLAPKGFRPIFSVEN